MLYGAYLLCMRFDQPKWQLQNMHNFQPRLNVDYFSFRLCVTTLHNPLFVFVFQSVAEPASHSILMFISFVCLLYGITYALMYSFPFFVCLSRFRCVMWQPRTMAKHIRNNSNANYSYFICNKQKLLDLFSFEFCARQLPTNVNRRYQH